MSRTSAIPPRMGHQHVSLGQRPRNSINKNSKAPKGRHKRNDDGKPNPQMKRTKLTTRNLCRPFRARCSYGISYPGRCRGLTCGWPVGPERRAVGPEDKLNTDISLGRELKSTIKYHA